MVGRATIRDVLVTGVSFFIDTPCWNVSGDAENEYDGRTDACILLVFPSVSYCTSNLRNAQCDSGNVLYVMPSSHVVLLQVRDLQPTCFGNTI